MAALVYLRLIGFTAGTLLQLFWMVVILGYRRQRNFERVFFFLCLALFLYYGGSLLGLNALIYYTQPPPLLTSFAKIVLSAGLWFLPPLLLHFHFEYAETRGMLAGRTWKRVILIASYVPVFYFALHVYPALANASGFDFLIPGNSMGRGYGVWLALSLLASAAWQVRFLREAPDRHQLRFHAFLAALLFVGAAMTSYLHVLGGPLGPNVTEFARTALAFLAIPPGAILIYLVQRYNFLQIGRQKNLVYAVSATFLALLYLSLVRRVGVWLEPVLPPEASASILLFVLVIFIEPFQRILGRRLQETAHLAMDRVQRLTAEIQLEARQGNLAGLATFVELRVAREFELARASLTLLHQGAAQLRPFSESAHDLPAALPEQTFLVLRGSRAIAVLRAEPHGALLSGDTRAALEFLCEQLAGALELCQLLEEKVRLERELAERERLALLGQMAASISHNLKNPLGSIKTILQVQLENPDLPDAVRDETKMVLDEIGRLSAKLNQLLKFSRPTVLGSAIEANCDLRVAIEEVTGLLRHEAGERKIALTTRFVSEPVTVAAAPDAVSDILSNLMINALEAATPGGRISVAAFSAGGFCQLAVEDDGVGIPPSNREKIFQPFFTTKTQGTGLGLAIVARRVSECGGKLECISPLENNRGTRFTITLPPSPSRPSPPREPALRTSTTHHNQ